jgi:hypothetical protein
MSFAKRIKLSRLENINYWNYQFKIIHKFQHFIEKFHNSKLIWNWKWNSFCFLCNIFKVVWKKIRLLRWIFLNFNVRSNWWKTRKIPGKNSLKNEVFLEQLSKFEWLPFQKLD